MSRRRTSPRRAAVLLGLASTLAAAAPAAAHADGPTASSAALGTPRTIATGFNVPWGIAFTPGGSALVSERATARIKRVPKGGGTARTVMRIPGVATNYGEGGLLGIAVSPHYSSDHWVYAYYTSATDNRVVRFHLGGRVHTILKGIRRAGNHDGGRLTFGPDGKLYIGTGDATDGDLSQDTQSLNGKILRINPDGSIPSDNPFGNAVWSYGHRNVQGLAFDGAGRLWSDEFGENYRDEVNLITKGTNYGWPAREGSGDTGGGRFTNPVLTWPVPDASPSGAAIVGSTLYVAALRGQRLWQIRLNGTSAGTPRSAFHLRYGRIRTVVREPGGKALWITTSNGDGYGSGRPGADRILRVPQR
jgi:glucose/arabinose dehydrogenase